MISVIGAGPAGSFYASKVKDEEVHLFEEHAEVGKPVSCTGIVTDSVRGIVDIPEEIIMNKIKKFKIVAPNGKEMFVDLKKENMVINRAKFDQYLFQKAIENGAKVHLEEKFKGYEKIGKKYRIITTKGEYEADMLVGADGPFSTVAKAAGIYGERQFVNGFQARCEYPNLELDTTIVHLELGEFSWIVPENKKIARVGVIGTANPKLREDYKKLVGDNRILEYQSGTIPLFNPKQKFRKENIFLIGDAATQVKATTYGGVIYGLLAARFLAEDKDNYVRNFNKKLGKDLWISLKMREMLNTMTEEQCNELIEIFKRENANAIISEYDRDFPSKFIVKLLMKEAKLWKLGFSIFKNKITAK